MKIALIGRGRLATNLLPALQEAGHEVASINSRTLEDLPLEADVYIISVKDSALQEVISKVPAKVTPSSWRGLGAAPVFVHTAGSMPMSLFEGFATRYGVLYPMQTFSKERRVHFREIPVFIEATVVDGETADRQPTTDREATVVDGSAVDTTLALLRSLAESISDHVYELSTEQRKYLHLAAVFACNFANHCYALSADVLAQVGLPFDVMLPLIDETARKVHELHPLDAQTGPAVRYDENVMQAQQQLLDDPLMRDIYQKMSQSIHQRANENHDQLRLTEDTGHRV